MLNANPVKAYPEVYMGTLEKAMQERNVDAYLDSKKTEYRLVKMQSNRQSQRALTVCV